METNEYGYTEYGECRCCMAKGRHRDITTEYYYNNITEVYKEIFMECFNLSLSSHMTISPLICSTCVQRLRDAISFRMMVVSTERQLLQAIDGDKKDTVFVNVPDPTIEDCSNIIKTEIESEGSPTELDMDLFEDDSESQNSEIRCENNNSRENKSKQKRRERDKDSVYDCQDYDECDSIISTKEEEKIDVTEEEIKFLARFSRYARPLPKRAELYRICPEYDDHLQRLKNKIVKPKSIEWLLQAPKADKQSQFVSEKLALLINTSTIFQYSNATAFKAKMRNGYPCFYCREIFNHNSLREHQTVHPKSSIYKLLTKYTADELIVYADVTDLKCTLCNESIKNISALKSHLVDRHEKKIYMEYSDRVIAFKLKETEFECQICGLQFETFGAVERHTNKHYRNFICEECGAGFITKARLTVHAYSLHKNGVFPCNICKKTFASQLKLKNHYDGVHKMLKKYKCTKCPEKFIDYFTRQKHLVDVHGEEPILYKCSICNRAFNRKFSLTLHMRRCHLEQRDVKCDFCPYTCYTKTELKSHMIRHNGIKPFQCHICKKCYAKNRTLLLHMRTHSDSQRFSCVVCGMTFVHKSTLKGHMKTHQTDL